MNLPLSVGLHVVKLCNGREKLQQLVPIEILTYVRLMDSGG